MPLKCIQASSIILLLSGMAQIYAQCDTLAGFEHYSCCPQSYSQIACSDWQAPTDGTTDYLNLCGFHAFFSPASGSGFAGFFAFDYADTSGPWYQYREYIAQCGTFGKGPATLTFSLASYSITSTFQPCGNINYDSLTIAVFGSASCQPVSINQCPSAAPASSFILLGTASYAPQNTWSTVTVSLAIPYDLRYLAIGPACTLHPSYGGRVYSGCLPYFIIDDVVLRCGCSRDDQCDDDNACTLDRCMASSCYNFKGTINPDTASWWKTNCCACRR